MESNILMARIVVFHHSRHFGDVQLTSNPNGFCIVVTTYFKMGKMGGVGRAVDRPDGFSGFARIILSPQNCRIIRESWGRISIGD